MNTTPSIQPTIESEIYTNGSEKVREFVVEHFFHGDDNAVQETTSFFEEGKIRSRTILELVKFLEEAYNIKIQNDEIIPENLDNLQNISRFIDKKQNRFQSLYYY
ncbi:MAG: acyl carrier protein [Sedimentisphaerales bacterium]|nr:acyl carrier protein [Sedimentisphaerales bacterium]